MRLQNFMLIYGLFFSSVAYTQERTIRGTVRDRHSSTPLVGCSIYIKETTADTLTDAKGHFAITIPPAYNSKFLHASYSGYQPDSIKITNSDLPFDFHLVESDALLNEVVISATMSEVSKKESPIPVEVYAPAYFRKNPTSNIFEALTMVNGVQPQLNCSVCNTGDIHINGMEGPYTMILIDGMPIVSSLSTVYGLSGIPNSMVRWVEISKGPASTLYGSEAVGGLINIITKDPVSAPLLFLELSGTSWNEYHADVSSKFRIRKATSLVGVNAYWFNTLYDKNKDGFTDVTLQKRISVFNKWNFDRNDLKLSSLALRYVHENRWGGEKHWTPEWRGTDSIYGENIFTHRFELIGHYDLPFKKEKFRFQYSYNYHYQNSYYGTVKYYASQHTAFAQLLWNKTFGRHDLLTGIPFRIISYDDNSPATEKVNNEITINRPSVTILPGVFVQHEWKMHSAFTILSGMRYDYNHNHGNIFTPRLSLKYSPAGSHTLRVTGGNGYRVVNLFTEDHAALSGAREVVIAEKLRPELSWNVNLNYVWQWHHRKGFLIMDFSGFYTYFTNKIVADFDSDPDKIIYDNLKGYAVSRGVSLNADFNFTNGLKMTIGGTWMDVYQSEKNTTGQNAKIKQLFAPNLSGTYAVSYTIHKIGLIMDWTGLVKSPMRLPVLPNDFRPEYSPWFCLMNIQLTQKIGKKTEVFAGLKNLLNFVPAHPIMRPEDPFDKQVNDPVTNPNGYTFDPSYNYAPVQGIRAFFGIRWNL